MFSELIKRTITSIVIFVLTFYCFVKGSYFFNTLILLIFFTSIYEWYKLALNKLLFIFGFFFILLSVIAAYILRNDNLSFFMLVILVSVFTDLGGFICGKIFKGPKLTKLSPNKTYSGSLGSFVFSIILSLIYIKFIDNTLINSIKINFTEYLITIVFLSSVSQIGDLVISYFKRLRSIKNTGKIFPGHGGLLDRIDGIIFTVPTSYLIIFLFF